MYKINQEQLLIEKLYKKGKDIHYYTKKKKTSWQ
jgi:hypothetical protein